MRGYGGYRPKKVRDNGEARRCEMLDGVMDLWFAVTAMSVVFVVVDIRSTPESPVLKWGFALLTIYTGPLGAFLYVLGCREPLPGLHERYVAVRWRQVLGSTMHCVAGDGVGILAGAVIASVLHLTKAVDIGLEYALGFGFGWSIFQALFMMEMANSSYAHALRKAFMPEFLSMNCLMAGMVPVMLVAMKWIPAGNEPTSPAFWFVMSMALLVGFISAYPMNWWLVSHHMKHGMMTVRDSSRGALDDAKLHDPTAHPASLAATPGVGDKQPPMSHSLSGKTTQRLFGMGFLSVVAFGTGLEIARLLLAH